MAQRVSLNSGDQIYKYNLQNRIGGGGFGDVWFAHDDSISRDVAVKVLASNVTINERLQEARIGNQLEHENLVKIHYADVVEHNGENLVIITMAYHPSGSIVNKINSANFLILPDTIRYLIDILRGLEYLHELNIFHGDIKPQNILIGEYDQGLLTDYGLSRQSTGGQSISHGGFYKLHVAPEMLNTDLINIQTDVYQVGITAFRLFNGIGTIQDKYNQLGEQSYYQIVQQGKVVQHNDYQPFIPRNLKSLINKAVHVDPTSRYQSALEMRRAFERLSYPGYWTSDPSGNLIGHNANHEFRYKETPKGTKYFDFTAFKKNRSTGRETRIGNFSSKRINRNKMKENRRNFLQWVVTG